MSALKVRLIRPWRIKISQVPATVVLMAQSVFKTIGDTSLAIPATDQAANSTSCIK